MKPMKIVYAAFVIVAALLIPQRAMQAQELEWERLSGSGTGAEVSSMVVDSRGVAVLLTANGRVYREEDGCWQLSSMLPGSGSFYVGGAGVILALSVGALFVSEDGGVQWRQVAAPDSHNIISAGIDSAGVMWAFSSDGYGQQNSLFRSSDNGLTWTSWLSEIPERWELFAISDGTLYAATVQGKLLRLKTGVTACDTLVPLFPLGSDGGEYRLTYDRRSGRLYCCSNVLRSRGWTYFSAGYLQVSLDKGDTWISLCPPAPGSWGGYLYFERIAAACPLEDMDIAIAAGSMIYRTTDDGQHWTEHLVEEGRLVQLAASPGGVLFAGGKRGISRSSNSGVSWTHFNAGLAEQMPYATLEVSPSSLMLLGNSDLYLSEDEGRSWRQTFTGSAGDWRPYNQFEGYYGMYGEVVLSLAIPLQNRGSLAVLFGGSGGDGSYYVEHLYHSEDNGESWVFDTTFGFWRGGDILGPSINRSHAGQWLVRTGTGTIYQSTDTADWDHYRYLSVVRRSRDDGQTWQVISGPDWPSLPIDRTNFWRVGVTGDGSVIVWCAKWMYRSTDEGESWTTLNLQLPVQDSIVACAVGGESSIFAATAFSGLFCSTDFGSSWRRTDAGVNSEEMLWMFVARGRVLLLGTSNGIYRSLIPLDPLNVVKNPVDRPSCFRLHQNYPNPFNPTTTITFELPVSAHATLSVFDLLGREIARLVDDRLERGVYQAKFDASRLSSGVYLYRLKAGGGMMTKKMVLAR